MPFSSTISRISSDASAERTALKSALAQVTAERNTAIAERDRIRAAYQTLLEQVALLQRRIFVAKAERVDTAQLELEFAEKLSELRTLAQPTEAAPSADSETPEPPEPKKKTKPKGRRNLRALNLPEERVEILDPELEGKAERIGFEESCKLGYQRGGARCIVIARATYKLVEKDTPVKLVTAPLPKELLARSMLAPSMLAHLVFGKYGLGLPFYRLEEKLRGDGIELDRGSMSRYAEDVGATLGAIVDACAKEAKEKAFCLSTDATGIAIQPERIQDRVRQACRKGHFFVILADRDHIFFEYQPKHTSAAVCEMFRGFSGYIQADAHVIYDALFRGEALGDNLSGADPPTEVGCWSHCRRKFWEAAVCKHSLGREGVMRVRLLFEKEALFSDLPPSQRAERRREILGPLLDEFFAWANAEYERLRHERGLVTSALGYAVRQEAALRRFLEDGRLRMENNASERALRRIAVGRKNWLFFGSDDHAIAAANLFSLIASCKLHKLDAELYLAELIRVMPFWPRDRYIELAPKSWTATRARLDPIELARPLGHITVPPPATKE